MEEIRWANCRMDKTACGCRIHWSIHHTPKVREQNKHGHNNSASIFELYKKWKLRLLPYLWFRDICEIQKISVHDMQNGKTFLIVYCRKSRKPPCFIFQKVLLGKIEYETFWKLCAESYYNFLHITLRKVLHNFWKAYTQCTPTLFHTKIGPSKWTVQCKC